MRRHTDQDGIVWRPYEVTFVSPEGTFAVEVCAISDEHAHLQVQALRETAVLVGRIVERVENE